MKMWVERVESLALPGHDDDQAFRRDPPQFGERLAVVENVFDDVGTDHGIELSVGERQLFGNALEEFNAGVFRTVRNHDVDADKPLRFCRTVIAKVPNEEAAAAADVANRTPDDLLCDPLQAQVRIVGLGMDARPLAIERRVLLLGKEWRSLSEIPGRIHAAKGEAGGQPEEPAVSDDRGQQILDDEPNLVRGFSSQRTPFGGGAYMALRVQGMLHLH